MNTASVTRRPIAHCQGVGPALSEKLAKLGIRELQDALFHLPLRYQDRTHSTPLGSLRPGEETVVHGVVEHTAVSFRPRPTLLSYISDGTGGLLLRFFHFRRALEQRLARGTTLLLFGEARAGNSGLEMIHPEFITTLDTRLTPIYPSAEGLPQNRLRHVIAQALDICLQANTGFEDLLPAAIIRNSGLPDLKTALLTVHRPEHNDLARLREGRHPAIQRLAFEELLAHHLSLLRLRQNARVQTAPRFQAGQDLLAEFFSGLGFTPTQAQIRVENEIAADLAQPAPMLRLLQGDVGSGKTLVAAAAALRAVASGYQTAVMAPTEILAEQHYRNFQAWLTRLDIDIAYLSGKLASKARREALQQIAAGAPLVIGTHALFQQDVVFKRLGLVIIDEQHRFGVHQRLALRTKGTATGEQPHQLILTATPIPRTLAMTAYADLDCSVIDELPPGRSPVKTAVMSVARRADIIARIRLACRQGRQAYWVCTLIEESEILQCQAAEATAKELQQILPEIPIGLVHGRMKPRDKTAVMQTFKAGEIQLLVATTVIEVGVDVPNASLMIIENAERLGLSQLHQLRGRVGRGQQQSTCLLLYQPPLGQVARQRLQILRTCNDGFSIAQQDLEMRGPGEVLGTRQTGQLQFRIADLQRDAGLLESVREAGELICETYPARLDALLARWLPAAENYARV